MQNTLYVLESERETVGRGQLIEIPFEIHLMAQVLTASQDEAQKETKRKGEKHLSQEKSRN